MREVENLKEAGSRGAGLRILIGQAHRLVLHLRPFADGIAHLVKSAIELADITTEDPHAGLPDADEFGSHRRRPAACTPTTSRRSIPAVKIDMRQARRGGRALRRSADLQLRRRLVRQPRGPPHLRQLARLRGRVPLQLLLAEHGRRWRATASRMERDYWYTMARGFAGLEAPEHVGRMAAAARAAPAERRSRWRPRRCRWSSSRAPRASLLDNIFEAVHGMSIYRHESFLAGKLGEKVASENLTVIDDGTIPGLFGTSPFDDEGVPSRRTVVIERGVLKSYLLNTYAARKLGMKTTGNASRGLTGNAGIGHGNFFLEKGVQTPEQIIAGIPNGFYVTELMGFGVNIVTGDYSRGAAGLWIRNGELAFAVSEVTIAGNLKDMLMGIEAIGSRPGVPRLGGRAYTEDWRDDRWRQIKRQVREARASIPPVAIVIGLVLVLGWPASSI